MIARKSTETSSAEDEHPCHETRDTPVQDFCHRKTTAQFFAAVALRGYEAPSDVGNLRSLKCGESHQHCSGQVGVISKNPFC